jgi:aromatic ring-opening dioxygenase catalytic subunit (LigB family)
VIDSAKNAIGAEERNENLKELIHHPFFRRAHPREEHFVPIYIAAGAGGGEGEGAHVLADIHSAISIAFGV